MTEVEFLPQHYLIRLNGVPQNILDDEQYILSSLINIANNINCAILKYDSQKFTPQGLTVFLLLAESHISYHTITEQEVCYIDIFTCTKIMNGMLGVELIKELIPHKEFNMQYIMR